MHRAFDPFLTATHSFQQIKMIIIQTLLILAEVYYLTAQQENNTTICPLQDPAVINFRKYLEIDTSRSENLYKAVEFLRSLSSEVGLDFAVYEPAGIPICVLTWQGLDSSLPSIMLNSHMDVVEVDEARWNYPPFEAHVDENCNVFARGAQDTKDVGIQYIEAIRRLKKKNVTLNRTIHVTFMPDEETGGFRGMRAFLEMDKFKELNVGFALDEGLPSASDKLYATYQDRRAWSLNFTIMGTGGHGFLMPEDVAVEKLQRLLDVMLDYRKSLKKPVESVDPVNYGPYTTMNINMINGGFAPNVIPTSYSLVADMRLGATENATEMLARVNSWVEYAGEGTKLEFLRREMESLATPIDDSNLYWLTFKDTIKELDFELVPIISPATSDMLFVRNYGIPALGFTTKYRTTQKAHQDNEYLNLTIFLHGINIYEALIKNLGNLS